MMHSQRPLSPHLQIYKPQITSMLSITHRLTGLVLTTAVVALVFWVFALASKPACFYAMLQFYQSWFGKFLLWGWWTSFFYHFANGIRHLVWDTGFGFELKETYASGWTVAILTCLMAAIGLVVIF
jgi:succinate dehydrogenase / fumarate reductase cytochrome b subunit